MTSITPIIINPAYNLHLRVQQRKAGTTLTMVSVWPTARRPTEVCAAKWTLQREELERLHAAIGEALERAGVVA